MPVLSVSQNEEVDAAGNIRNTYTATFQLEQPAFTGTVTVDGGPDWDTRLIAAIEDEAAKARAVGGLAL